MWKNRAQSGKMLAKALAEYKGKDAVVYALPRGGVVLGHEVAKELGISLDIVIARKVGHPYNPEYGICAVTEHGDPVCDGNKEAPLYEEWLKTEVAKERQEAKRRREAYMDGRERINAKGKIAIVVDDGVATGLTMLAALDELRKDGPAELVVAVPVAPYDSMNDLRAKADKLVVLKVEKDFLGAVGSYYEEFPQVSDKEVIELI